MKYVTYTDIEKVFVYADPTSKYHDKPDGFACITMTLDNEEEHKFFISLAQALKIKNGIDFYVPEHIDEYNVNITKEEV